MTEPSARLPPFAPEWIDRLENNPALMRDWDNAEAISPFTPYFLHSALISPPDLGITPFDASPINPTMSG
ncbi:hypothetical protein, partial [Vibrio parahaemolyticus]|uniref:hypothetical protein n=1 Tax=Vibrio parahaemolyticus TaxID=670 RepID=UPI0021131259